MQQVASTDDRDDDISSNVAKLIKAVQFGDFRTFQSMIEDSKISVSAADRDGCSLLHWAAINNRIRMCRYLIENGANINCVGGTLLEIPLQWAIRNNNYTFMAEILLHSGSNISHRNTHGHDSLHLACVCGSVHMVYIL
jgi:palmitoyltransferase